jgi:hypothetical protein
MLLDLLLRLRLRLWHQHLLLRLGPWPAPL